MVVGMVIVMIFPDALDVEVSVWGEVLPENFEFQNCSPPVLGVVLV